MKGGEAERVKGFYFDWLSYPNFMSFGGARD